MSHQHSFPLAKTRDLVSVDENPLSTNKKYGEQWFYKNFVSY